MVRTGSKNQSERKLGHRELGKGGARMKSYSIVGAVTTQMGLEPTSVLIEIPHLGGVQ